MPDDEQSESGDGGSSIDPTAEIGFWQWLNDLTWNEVHLMVLGLYAGFVAVRPRPRHKPVGRMNWEKNEWYWKGMYVAGYVLKVGVVGGIGLQNLPTITRLLGL